jgi:hypothetical protein
MCMNVVLYLSSTGPGGDCVQVHLHGEPGGGVQLPQVQLQAAHGRGEGDQEEAATADPLNLDHDDC